MSRLMLYVRTIRNNLFHGGKYTPATGGPVAEPARDERLLDAATIVIEAVLAASPDVWGWFQSSYY